MSALGVCEILPLAPGLNEKDTAVDAVLLICCVISLRQAVYMSAYLMKLGVRDA